MMLGFRSHPDPGDGSVNAIDWCGITISQVKGVEDVAFSSGDMEMGMVETHYCYYLRCLK